MHDRWEWKVLRRRHECVHHQGMICVVARRIRASAREHMSLDACVYLQHIVSGVNPKQWSHKNQIDWRSEANFNHDVSHFNKAGSFVRVGADWPSQPLAVHWDTTGHCFGGAWTPFSGGERERETERERERERVWLKFACSSLRGSKRSPQLWTETYCTLSCLFASLVPLC